MDTTVVEECPHTRTARIEARVGSDRLLYAIRMSRGEIWTCGHFKNRGNTHSVNGVRQCRQCRKERWLKGFRLVVLRKLSLKLAASEDREFKANQVVLALMRKFETPANALPFDMLFDGISRAFFITTDELRGQGRDANLVHARAVLVRILRERGLSFPAIGRLIGRRDHSTVMNSLRNYEIYERLDERVSQAYALLRDAEERHGN